MTELRNVVSSVQAKVEDFHVPKSTEKYLSLKVSAEFAQNEMQEDSELMQDLYKILPLTVDSLFDESTNSVNCQFDTLMDLETACKILTLVLETPLDSKMKTTAKKQSQQQTSFLQKILQAIWCRKRASSNDGASMVAIQRCPATPVKVRKAEVVPLLFENKKRTIEFDQVIDNVRQALSAFDAFQPKATG